MKFVKFYRWPLAANSFGIDKAIIINEGDRTMLDIDYDLYQHYKHDFIKHWNQKHAIRKQCIRSIVNNGFMTYINFKDRVCGFRICDICAD
jgi:hypothetical protein